MMEENNNNVNQVESVAERFANVTSVDFEGERKFIIPPTDIFADYAKHPLIQRMFLTDIGFYPKAAHHYKERVAGTNEYIYIYCTDGTGTIYVDDKKYILKKNQAFCIPRLRIHRYFADQNDPWTIFWVHLIGTDTVLFPLDECRIITFNSSHSNERMKFLFELLFRVLEGNYTLGNFIYISQVLSLILAETYYRERKNSTIEQNSHVTDVIRYMQNHMEENLTMSQILDEFKLSKSYLNVIFKKYTQHAPMDFYIRLKMKAACRLLKVSDLYVFEVAQRLGYPDQYYFSRVFKKVIGVSPTEYKNNDYYYEI